MVPLRLVEVERTSCCLVEARVLSSSFGLLVVGFCLRDWERERVMDWACLVGESEMVLEEGVTDVGVSRLRRELAGGLVGSGGGGNGRGWWRVETIALVEEVFAARSSSEVMCYVWRRVTGSVWEAVC